MRNEANIFRLIETGIDGKEGLHSDKGQEITDDDWNF